MVTGQSDTVVIALAVLSLIGTLATLIVGAVVAIYTRGNRREISDVKRTGQETARAVDGMTHELVAAQSGRASAEGFTAGEAAERDRVPSNGSPQPVEIVNPDPVPVVTTNGFPPVDKTG